MDCEALPDAVAVRLSVQALVVLLAPDDPYLEQLGIEYPTLRPAQRDRLREIAAGSGDRRASGSRR